MIDYEKEFGRSPFEVGATDVKTALSRTFKIVYGWMTVGLALSGVVAWYTAASGLGKTILQGPVFIGLIIAEFLLVLALTSSVRKLPVMLCYLMFLVYAALNGLTLSVVFIAYKLALVQKVFFITAGMFGGLVLWGSFTKDNLSSVGSLCGMALWGLIIAGLVNVFLGSSTLDWICSILGVLVFTGLTMYDAKKVRELADAEYDLDGAAVHRLGIIGALQLYLDFINLFLHILRLMRKR